VLCVTAAAGIALLSLHMESTLNTKSAREMGAELAYGTCAAYDASSAAAPDVADAQPPTFPKRIIQYGTPRTATTLQFQTLCALTAVLNPTQIVKCVYLDQFFINRGANHSCGLEGLVCSENDILVIKTHNMLNDPDFEGVDDSAATNKPWIFYSVASEEAWQEARGAAVVDTVNKGISAKASCTLLSEIITTGTAGLVEKYSRYFGRFGFSPEEAEKVLEYITLWDQLRLCCGMQMSKTHAKVLQGKLDELSPEDEEKEEKTCAKVSVGEVEQKVMQTEVCKQFNEAIPSLGTVSVEDGPFTGSYCEDFNTHIDEKQSQFWAARAAMLARGRNRERDAFKRKHSKQ